MRRGHHQHAERISHLIEKSFGRDRNSQAERGTNQVKNMLVRAPPRSSKLRQSFRAPLVERLQFIQIERR